MGVATMSSRILGMVRESVYATFMGDGWVAGAFTLAFMVPNLFRRLLGEGVLTAAFIPLLKEKEKQETEQATMAQAAAVRPDNTAFAACHIACSVSCFSFSLNSGIKAAVSTPSPRRRRKRFGTMKASVKAPATQPSPMNVA